MSLNCRNKFLFFILFVVSFIKIGAQFSQFPVTMEIEEDHNVSKSRLINIVIAFQNNSSEIFTGKLHSILPQGYKVISGADIPVNLQKGEKKYIPLRLIAETNAKAGSSELRIQLLSNSGVILSEKITTHTIEVDNNLTMTSLSPIIFRTADNEPVSVKIRIANTGNVPQSISLVCKFPDADKGNVFVEQEAEIGVKRDSVFTFTYQPSKSLSGTANYVINISGFRNPEKEIFNTTSITVQNIASKQRYQEPQYSSITDPSKNEITTSFRRVGQNLNMYQIYGNGGFNLPSGYLFLRGNASIFSNQQLPVITNTNISLFQGNNEYHVGSVNKMFETTLSGRGAEYIRHFGTDKKIEVAFVDQNFNLIEKNAFLKNGYGFFAKGSLNTNNDDRNASAAYIYRYDPFEKAKHHILGTEGNYTLNKKWKLNGKLNTGLSSYEEQDVLKPSLAFETNYKGSIDEYDINGNYFYSSAYFPGNRRGSMQIQQNITKNFGDYNIFTSFNYSNFSPKFYFFTRSQISDNTRFDLGLKLPSVKKLNFGLIYQYQNESSNSFNNFFGNWMSEEAKQMSTHRLIESLTWSDNKTRQSAVLSLENGFVQYPLQDSPQFQLRFNANYNFRKLNFNAIYQKGSYYLSEYAFTYRINKDEEYKKLALSLFYNEQFLERKLSISTGASYADDIIYGKAPSAFINAKYNAKKFGAFFNSSWYNYSVGSLSNNILTLEVGITINLKKAVLDPGKKGKIQIFTFYDENNNNIYDPEEKPANDYIVSINNVVLKTDALGTALYKDVPFGNFELKQLIQQGWYYDEQKLDLDKYNYPLQIPLHQNGTMTGKLFLDYNAATSLEFDIKTSSIYFNILKDNRLIERFSADEEGKFTSFLPTGNYTVIIDEASLPTNVYCEQKIKEVNIKAGEITKIPDFVIKVKEKRVNKKTFSN